MAALSDGHGWQADERIIAQRGDGFQCHISGALNGPFIVLFEQQRTDQSDDGVFIGEDTDNLAAPLDLAVEAFEGIGIGYAGAGFRRVYCEVDA